MWLPERKIIFISKKNITARFENSVYLADHYRRTLHMFENLISHNDIERVIQKRQAFPNCTDRPAASDGRHAFRCKMPPSCTGFESDRMCTTVHQFFRKRAQTATKIQNQTAGEADA